jgi:thiol-disulfide isomerase/thioredoxin
MATARVAAGLMATCVLLGAVTADPVWAQTNADKVTAILKYRPRQEGVAISTPTPEEAVSCKLEVFRGNRPGSTGYLLKDPQGRTLRKFFDSDGDGKVDLWSYFKDGVEVYRDTAINLTNNSDKLPVAPNDFRWLNGGGSKWGVDVNGDGKISYWRMISPEEVAQEAFQALVTRDYARLQALFIREKECRDLKLPAAEITRIMDLQKQAQAKFEKTLEKLSDLSKANFVRVESGPPQTTTFDPGTPDLIKYPSRSILYENGGKHDWLQTGEMIQIGRATWRLVDAPTPGDMPPTEPPPGGGATNPELQKILEKVSDLDAKPPANDAPKADILRYNQERVNLVKQALAKMTEAKDRETWTKQLADNLSTLIQAGDTDSRQPLVSLKDEVTKAMPKSNLAGYLTYRVLWTDYAPKLAKGGDNAPKVQQQWMGELAKFVVDYPKAEDTPDALHQLAVGSEFAGKDDEARRLYQQLASNFPDNALAAKAQGAVKRLELVGKPMELTGTTTAAATFDLKSLSGKVVVVYYWASYCEVCTGDFARIKQMLSTHGPKGMELVTVNLDDRPEEATKYLQNTPMPGAHLVQPPATGQAAGLTGPLALQYGINGLPSMFLVGKDGKVISTKMQINDLEDAVKKAQ